MKALYFVFIFLLASCSNHQSQRETNFTSVTGGWFGEPLLCSRIYPNNVKECERIAEVRYHEKIKSNTLLIKGVRDNLNIKNKELEFFTLDDVPVNEHGEVIPYGEFTLDMVVSSNNLGNKYDLFVFSHPSFYYYIILSSKNSMVEHVKGVRKYSKLYTFLDCGYLSSKFEINNTPSYIVTPISCY